MLTYPEIDPIIVSLGPLKIRWYGVTYLVAFTAGWWLGRVRAARSNGVWDAQQIEDMVFFAVLGVILGGRIGYTLFYNFNVFSHDPLVIFRIWQGGMSFHGGLLGVLLSMWLFARKYKFSFFQVTDFLAPLIPMGLAAGRIGNFINAELWGRVSDVPWAMVFPNAGPFPRHPSQLYEALLEGVLLFIIMWLYSAKQRPTMAVSGLFLACYGSFRFAVEWLREPDEHIRFLAFDWLTMGQILSLPMVIIGAGLLWLAYKNQPRSLST